MFDPYHKWPGIPADQRPPTFYQLLGIERGESEREVIASAQDIPLRRGRRGLVRPGRDAIAVSCNQEGGPRGIDVGLRLSRYREGTR